MTITCQSCDFYGHGQNCHWVIWT